MRRRRPPLSVQLFPFLSVLLCTLGALILLLLVLDQRGRRLNAEEIARRQQDLDDQADRAAREIHSRLAALAAESTLLKNQINSTWGKEQEAEATLRRVQEDLARFEHELVRDRARLTDLDRSAREQRAMEHQIKDRRQAADSARHMLLGQIQSLEAAVGQLKEELSRRPPVHALIPYKGKHGSDRRPIFVECSGRELTFRPSGRSLSLDAAEEPGRLAALVREEAARQTDPASPYVLLLVRPSGIAGYYSVMRGIQNSNIDVGYEFVQEDWVFEFTGASGREMAGVDGSLSTSGGTAGRHPGSMMVSPGGKEPIAATGMGGTGGGRGPNPLAGQAGANAGLLPRATSGGGGARAGVGPGAPGPAGGLPGNDSRVGSEPASAPASGPSRQPIDQRPEPGPAERDSRDPNGKPRPIGEPEPDPSGLRKPGNPGERKANPEGEPGEEPGFTLSPVVNPTPQRPPLPRGVTQPREWEIVIECRANEVILQDQRFPASTLSQAANPLQAALRRRIEERRQRYPDVKPRLRFVIHPDALRVYYAASGAVEGLKLPARYEVLRK